MTMKIEKEANVGITVQAGATLEIGGKGVLRTVALTIKVETVEMMKIANLDEVNNAMKVDNLTEKNRRGEIHEDPKMIEKRTLIVHAEDREMVEIEENNPEVTKTGGDKILLIDVEGEENMVIHQVVPGLRTAAMMEAGTTETDEAMIADEAKTAD